MSSDMNSSNFVASMDYFDRLPEVCKVEIISSTTPADAVRSIILSKEFKSIAESDEIWGRFLPKDYQEIIDRSEFPPICNTKKELFFSLCDSPIILDGGKLSFFLDKHTGKKCFVIAPRELTIWGRDSIYSWKWIERRDSRFFEAEYLNCSHGLDIRGRIGIEMLSPKTEYAAYLVFKLDYRSHGLESAQSSIRFVDNESEYDNENQANTVHFARSQVSRDFPKMRGDGWMELELGYFNRRKGTDGPVEARLFEMEQNCKGGLIVEGIEFRPK